MENPHKMILLFYAIHLRCRYGSVFVFFYIYTFRYNSKCLHIFTFYFYFFLHPLLSNNNHIMQGQILLFHIQLFVPYLSRFNCYYMFLVPNYDALLVVPLYLWHYYKQTPHQDDNCTIFLILCFSLLASYEFELFPKKYLSYQLVFHVTYSYFLSYKTLIYTQKNDLVYIEVFTSRF